MIWVQARISFDSLTSRPGSDDNDLLPDVIRGSPMGERVDNLAFELILHDE